MDGKLAEAVLLTSHARVALANIEPFSLNLEHKSFTGTASLTFEVADEQAASAGPPVATTLLGWFEYLRTSAVRSITLRSDAGIGVSRPDGMRVWRQSSELVQPRPADGRIWAVRYCELAAKDASAPAELAVDEATERLREVVEACENLARDGGEPGWAKFFGNARSELAVSSPPQRSHLLPPRGYTQAAQRLLRGCELSWAFGGMGSWNDFEFAVNEHRRRYDHLTLRLKSALFAGVTAAVNAELNPE